MSKQFSKLQHIIKLVILFGNWAFQAPELTCRTWPAGRRNCCVPSGTGFVCFRHNGVLFLYIILPRLLARLWSKSGLWFSPRAKALGWNQPHCLRFSVRDAEVRGFGRDLRAPFFAVLSQSGNGSGFSQLWGFKLKMGKTSKYKSLDLTSLFVAALVSLTCCVLPFEAGLPVVLQFVPFLACHRILTVLTSEQLELWWLRMPRQVYLQELLVKNPPVTWGLDLSLLPVLSTGQREGKLRAANLELWGIDASLLGLSFWKQRWTRAFWRKGWLPLWRHQHQSLVSSFESMILEKK